MKRVIVLLFLSLLRIHSANGMLGSSLNDVPSDVIEHKILPFVLNKDVPVYSKQPDIKSPLPNGLTKKDEDIKTIRSLRLVNKKFFRLINKESVARYYIEVLAQHHKQPPIDIALQLRTIGASKWINRSYEPKRYLAQRVCDEMSMEKKGAVNFLLHSCPELVQYPIYCPDQPLHYAARTGKYHFVKKILETRAPINERGQYGYTPLYWAIKNGHASVAELLLDAGADSSLEINYNFVHPSNTFTARVTPLTALYLGYLGEHLSEHTTTQMIQLIRSRMPPMSRFWSHVEEFFQ